MSLSREDYLLWLASIEPTLSIVPIVAMAIVKNVANRKIQCIVAHIDMQDMAVKCFWST